MMADMESDVDGLTDRLKKMSNDSLEKRRLRILTYMCPEVPVETFCTIRDCLEEATGLEVDLLVEDRFNGPPPHRTNPFTADLADLVVVHSSDFLRLSNEHQEYMELCPAAPVYRHHQNADRPVYFSEIIIHASNKNKFKSIKDLKGCSWAYTDDSSLSGNTVVLSYLKDTLKTNASYFGTIVQSGSHLNSIKMVRDYRVDAAAVASTVLTTYLQEHEDHEDKFVSLVSLGPLPIYPFLFNTRLPAELKQKVVDAMLSTSKNPKWAMRLNDVGIQRFVVVDKNLYGLEEDIQRGTSGMSINTTYY